VQSRRVFKLVQGHTAGENSRGSANRRFIVQFRPATVRNGSEQNLTRIKILAFKWAIRKIEVIIASLIVGIKQHPIGLVHTLLSWRCSFNACRLIALSREDGAFLSWVTNTKNRRAQMKIESNHVNIIISKILLYFSTFQNIETKHLKHIFEYDKNSKC
jgi:hypothetical protein